jgi:hypothetical protein
MKTNVGITYQSRCFRSGGEQGGYLLEDTKRPAGQVFIQLNWMLTLSLQKESRQ